MRIVLILAAILVSSGITAVFVFSWTAEYYGKREMWWRDEWDKVRSELARFKGDAWLPSPRKGGC